MSHDNTLWAEKDKGQLDRYDVRPTIPLPCALVRVAYPKSETLTDKVQDVTARIMFRIAFIQKAATSTGYHKEDVQKWTGSFDAYNNVQHVYELFQGLVIGRYTAWQRVGQVEEPRPDDITVVQLTFQTTFIDESASDLQTIIN